MLAHRMPSPREVKILQKGITGANSDRPSTPDHMRRRVRCRSASLCVGGAGRCSCSVMDVVTREPVGFGWQLPAFSSLTLYQRHLNVVRAHANR